MSESWPTWHCRLLAGASLDLCAAGEPQQQAGGGQELGLEAAQALLAWMPAAVALTPLAVSA